MKKLNIKWMLSLIAAFTFASCDTDVDHDIPAVDAPVLVSTTPESGAAKVKTSQQWMHRYWCLLLLKVEQPK